jgi:hypothetical protein
MVDSLTIMMESEKKEQVRGKFSTARMTLIPLMATIAELTINLFLIGRI